MARNRKRHSGPGPAYGFAVAWVLAALLLPMYRLWALLAALGLSCAAAYLIGRREGKAAAKEQAEEQPPVQKKAKAAPEQPAAGQAKGQSVSPEISAVLQEGNRALSEMGRIYMSVRDPEIRKKINELMRVTDKIVQDALADPSDLPQIRKFLNYYLPTTIKLLNAYDRMSDQGIQGENLDKSMKSIEEMLDTATVAFEKMLDSLFENQALDIETDIQVMNTMLAREGLSGEKDFVIGENAN